MNRETTASGYQKAMAGAWVGIFANALLAAVKFAAALWGRSTALMADAIHTFSDIFTTVLILGGLRTASQPPDKSHPYGHGKAEALTARLVSLILILVALGIGRDAYYKISTGVVVEAPRMIVLWTIVVSCLVKEGLYQYRVRLGRKLGSSSTIADAWHHRSDALSSAAVLIGVGGAILGGSRWYILDPLAAFVVALIILWIGGRIWLRTSRELMDEILPAPLLEKIRLSALKTEGVKGTEKIYGRKAGMDILVDIHVEVDPKMSVEKSHEIAREVEKQIIRDLPAVKKTLVHIEPYYRHTHRGE